MSYSLYLKREQPIFALEGGALPLESSGLERLDDCSD